MVTIKDLIYISTKLFFIVLYLRYYNSSILVITFHLLIQYYLEQYLSFIK